MPGGHSRRRRGPQKRRKRGLDKEAILDAAFAMLAREGEAGFSVRKVAAAIGVDPMTVLHHFRCKNDLLRAIADRALTTVELPSPSKSWKTDLRRVAAAYRDLAHRYPRIFHLHFRYHATGAADHASSEVVYRALLSTGLKKAQAAGLGLAFYAFVLGFALAETEGLLAPLNDAEEAELTALDPGAVPATVALIPAFRALDPDTAFASAIGAFIAGVATLTGGKENARRPTTARRRVAKV
ncbi:MAG: TetR/AcrR family transcriptional regulator [Hyphomicrobium sp.]